MRRVIVESPFRGDKLERVGNRAKHETYVYAAMYDCLLRGEAPFASHALYTKSLNDGDAIARKLGIEAGLAWGKVAEATVVYTDFGITEGMEQGIKRAIEELRTVEYRKLYEADPD